MSEKKEKYIRRLERKVADAEEDAYWMENYIGSLKADISCQDQKIYEETKKRREAHEELRTAKHAIRVWRCLTYAALVVSIVILALAIMATYPKASAAGIPEEPVRVQIISVEAAEA